MAPGRIAGGPKGHGGTPPERSSPVLEAGAGRFGSQASASDMFAERLSPLRTQIDDARQLEQAAARRPATEPARGPALLPGLGQQAVPTPIDKTQVSMRDGLPVLAETTPRPPNGIVRFADQTYQLITVRPAAGAGLPPGPETPNVFARAIPGTQRFAIIDPHDGKTIGFYDLQSHRYQPRIRAAGVDHPKAEASDEEYVSASEDIGETYQDAPAYTDREKQRMMEITPYDPRRRAVGSFYDPVNNGRPVLRAPNGEEIKILKIAAAGINFCAERPASEWKPELMELLRKYGYPEKGTEQYKTYLTEATRLQLQKVSSSGVRPFISSKTPPEVRASMYDNNLDVRRITKDDVPGEEHALIGQWGVFTKREIKKDTVIGVYGGYVFELAEAPADDPYMLSADPNKSRNPKIPLVAGDNALAMVNTKFAYDAAGRPVRQAESGYNLDVAWYNINIDPDQAKKFELPERLALAAFVANKDIPVGDELRMNYGYDPATITRLTEPHVA